MRAVDLTVGQDYYGFTVTRLERPHMTGHRGIWVRCPACGDEVCRTPSNLRAAKSCGCLQHSPERPERVWVKDEDAPWNQPNAPRSRRRKKVAAPAKNHPAPPVKKKPAAPKTNDLLAPLFKTKSEGEAKPGRWQDLEKEFSKAILLDFRYAERMAKEANDLIHGTGAYRLKRNQV